jgi:hypothetical protein
MEKAHQKRDQPAHTVAVTDWLLATATPSIRYLTLRHLLHRPDTDPKVSAAWQAMRTSGPIPIILAKQTKAGNWTDERSYYTPKYTSTHWNMLSLVELAADGADPRLRRGAEFMLTATQRELSQALRTGKHGLSCFWGNLLRYALHSNLQNDPRVNDIIHYLIRDIQETGWRCPHNYELPCAWGGVRALWGLAALPGERTSQTEAAIRQGTTWLLETHRLVEANYPAFERIHPLWFRLNFPLFYQADILFVLRVLAELGSLSQPDAQPALEWLVARRKSNGRWRGASPFRRRTWAALATLDDTHRWATLHAAKIVQ